MANDSNEESTAPTVKLFSTLLREEQERIRVLLYAMFPEILGNRGDKYNNPSLFLLTRYGIINPSFRDMFSAGGQVELPLYKGVLVKMPAAFGRIQRYRSLILETLQETSLQTLSENWGTSVNDKDRIRQWCELCAMQYATTKDNLGYDIALEVLEKMFSIYKIDKEDVLSVAEP